MNINGIGILFAGGLGISSLASAMRRGDGHLRVR